LDGSEHRRYVRTSQISNFIFNLAINAGLAMWLLRSSEMLEVWGDAAYGPDLLITGFLLSALVAAIVIEIHKRKAASGAMESAPLTSSALRYAATRNRWAVCFGVGCWVRWQAWSCWRAWRRWRRR
jgi:hypothetical protein